MPIRYINQIFDNYYSLSLEDRKKLMNCFSDLHEKECFNYNLSYNYTRALKYINETIDQLIKSNNFNKFYSKLNDKQRKEFQIQTYLLSKNFNNEKETFIFHPLYERISELICLGENIEENKTKEALSIDFEKVEGAINFTYRASRICPEDIISTYCKLFYGFAIERPDKDLFSEEKYSELVKKYSYPLVYELKAAIQACSEKIESNINDNTKKIFNSLTQSNKILVILELLTVDEEKLNEMIVYRDCLREEQIERFNKINELGIQKRLVKMQSNKINDCVRFY